MINDLLQNRIVSEWLDLLHKWLVQDLLVVSNLIQALVLLLVLALGWRLGRKARVYLNERVAPHLTGKPHLTNIFQSLVKLQPFICSLVLLWIAGLILGRFYPPSFLIGLVQTLLLAWVVIQLLSSLILDRLWSRVIAALAWTFAALHIVGALGPALEFLDSFGLTVGAVRLTVLSLIKAVVVLVAMLKLGNWLADYLENKLKDIEGLSPSANVLLSKAIKITTLTIVVIIALNSVGIDLTALAVFSGAVGVGVGFGLQKVVANLISGIILLVDKSIKPGDVIQVGDVFGWITDLRGRYISVATRDGKEYLIPNEDLITQQVVNWSYSNRNVRVRIPVGISYKADPHRAIELILAAAASRGRVLSDPRPVCNLAGFGDNSIDLELRFWIDDPQNGLANIRSEILLDIWDRFRESGIEIPFPQRDVHLDIQSLDGLKELLGRRDPAE